MSVIKVKNLTKIYENKKVALEDVSFEIRKGEIVGLVGRNGAGKTTLMKCILGLLKFQKGEIYINGCSVSDSFDKVNKKIGFLLRPTFYDHLNAYENLKIITILLGKNNPSFIDEILKFVNLFEVRYKKVREYSFGMKQRLGLARTLIVEPEILILDEPLVGLDPIGTVEMKKRIRKIAKEEGKTILFSTHLLGDVEELCDRIIMLDDGKIIANDTLENIKNKKKYILKIKGNVSLKSLDYLEQHAEVIFKNDKSFVFVKNKEYLNSIVSYICKNGYKILDIEVESFKLSKLFERRGDMSRYIKSFFVYALSVFFFFLYLLKIKEINSMNMIILLVYFLLLPTCAIVISALTIKRKQYLINLIFGITTFLINGLVSKKMNVIDKFEKFVEDSENFRITVSFEGNISNFLGIILVSLWIILVTYYTNKIILKFKRGK